VIIFIVIVLSVVGNMGYNDEMEIAQHYCAQVRAGAWPDFDKSIVCEGLR